MILLKHVTRIPEYAKSTKKFKNSRRGQFKQLCVGDSISSCPSGSANCTGLQVHEMISQLEIVSARRYSFSSTMFGRGLFARMRQGWADPSHRVRGNQHLAKLERKPYYIEICIIHDHFQTISSSSCLRKEGTQAAQCSNILYYFDQQPTFSISETSHCGLRRHLKIVNFNGKSVFNRLLGNGWSNLNETKGRPP